MPQEVRGGALVGASLMNLTASSISSALAAAARAASSGGMVLTDTGLKSHHAGEEE